MIICLCYGVGDKQIKDAIWNQGARSAKDIQKLCGAGTDCGRCKCAIKAIVRAEKAKFSSHQAVRGNVDLAT